MLKSVIIEASSVSPTRVDFNIPSSLCTGIKVVDLGVYGTTDPEYLADPVLGQLAVINKIRLTENGQVLSQYDRRFQNLLQYKMFQRNNTEHRCIHRKLAAHNYGLVVNNGGSDSVQHPFDAAINAEAAVRPRICIDKKDLSRVFPAQEDTKLAMMDLSMVLGFMNASWDSANAELVGYVPCHLFKNLKLSIEFNTAASVAPNATQISRPYLIMDVIENTAMEKAFMGKVCEFIEHEVEEVYIGGSAQSNNFLNSFYGKTIANLHLMSFIPGTNLSPNLGNESLNLLVNQVPLFQQSGIDSISKRVAFTQMALGGDLYIPLTADRVSELIPSAGTSSDTSTTSIFEGPTPATAVASNQFSSGTCSYLAMPIQQKINSLQLRYTRTGGNAAYLLFFGEVAKVLQLDPKSGAPVASYV